MTPAAPPFETLLPKARFRNIQRVFETIPATVIGTKKSPKMKIESRKLLQSLCQGMESCEEEDDHSPRRAHSFHRMDSKDGTPSTSSRCFGDSHFEISDEDRDICSSRRETVKKTEPGGSERCREMKGDEHFLKEECIESILDDRYPFLDGNNRRNYYIIRSDGRLAEVFRTDLFDRLRKGINTNDESDDDDIPGSGLARMSDRWRAEWTNGIQIPLRANNPNPSEIRKAVVKRMTSRISRTLQKRRELLSEFYANAYEPIQATTLRLYECTILDELWVKLLNEQRTRTNSSLLPMETFLEIMNEFEIECYKNIHRKLLEPLHSPSSRIEDGDEEAACDICSAVDSEPDDEMVFCDGCNLCVHMSCYGLQELPPDEWLCMKCRLCFGRNPPCVLCPTTGGALKCTDTNQWAHVVCALWIPECRFGDFEKREPITRIHEIKEDRWSAKCSICDTRQGACIKCSVGSCMSSFHATCALRSGLEMRIESDPIDDRVHMISLCPRHRSAKPFAKDEAVCESSQAASDEETAGYYDSGPLAKLEQTFYDFVDHAAIAVKLELDPSLVADVFSYWVKKRLQLNKGKPLIENLQDEIKIVQPEPPQLELPVYTESNSHLPASPEPVKRKRGRPRKNPVDPNVVPLTPKPVTVAKEALRKMERLLHSLYGGQRLFDLVLKRYKEQRNFFNTHVTALLMITEQLSKPVPLSHRTDRFFNETLQSLCLKEVIEEGERRADEICGLNGLPPTGSRSSQRDDIPPSFESTPASTSSSESYHPPCLRNSSSIMRRLSSPKMISRRSLPISTKNSGKRDAMRESPDFEEQRRNRRKTLRSSDVKPAMEEKHLSQVHDLDSGPVVENKAELPSLSHDAQDEKAGEVVPAGATIISKRIEKRNIRKSLDTSAQKKRSLSKGTLRRSRALRRSDTRAAFSGTESPSPKRHRSAQTLGTELRLLKSLNLKNANKDFKHRWGIS